MISRKDAKTAKTNDAVQSMNACIGLPRRGHFFGACRPRKSVGRYARPNENFVLVVAPTAAVAPRSTREPTILAPVF